MIQPKKPISLQTCPSCKEQALMFNEYSNNYECLNCKDTFLKASIDKLNQQSKEEKNALNKVTEKETRAWSGNQYFDIKTKKWRNGKQPKRTRLGRYTWFWIIVIFILASVVLTLILNYFSPGSHSIIFWW